MTKILISYRRSDSAAIVGRIYDRLIARYGSDALFRDIDDIPAGEDFRDHVNDTLRQTDIVLAVIGPHWCAVAGARERIRETDDPVRVEIESALAAGIHLVPVLVDGATMPSATELPEALRPFAFANALTVSSGLDFHQHADRLIASLDRILGPKAPAAPAVAPVPVGLFRSPHSWAIVAALALPFAAAAGGLAPPWPRGAQFLTVIAQAALVVIVIQFVRSASRGAVSRCVLIAAVVLASTTVAYLSTESIFVYQTPATGEHWVKGFVCTREAVALYRGKCPFLTNDELRGAEYEAERLWTPLSIATVKVTIAALWFAAFLAAATLAAATAVGSLGPRRFS